MATAQQFEDLQFWQEARSLVKEVYRVSNQRLFSRDFSLRDQITRTATSTMSNIAEGFERGSRKEFMQFLTIAKASNGEVRSQLYAALDQDYNRPKDILVITSSSGLAFPSPCQIHQLLASLSK